LNFKKKSRLFNASWTPLGLGNLSIEREKYIHIYIIYMHIFVHKNVQIITKHISKVGELFQN
jgi:hypothetical protein